jgi:hypothetical protein
MTVRESYAIAVEVKAVGARMDDEAYALPSWAPCGPPTCILEIAKGEMTVHETLDARGENYGSFDRNAEIA